MRKIRMFSVSVLMVLMAYCGDNPPPPPPVMQGWAKMACEQYGNPTRNDPYSDAIFPGWVCYWMGWNDPPTHDEVQLCTLKVVTAYSWMGANLDRVLLVAKLCGAGAVRGVGVPIPLV